MNRVTQCVWPVGWLAGLAAALLTGCGDSSTRGSSTPTAMESPRSSAPSDTQRATPVAPDPPAGGSTGRRGVAPVPDASGGPPGGSGSSQGAAGAPPSRPPPGATSTPEPGATSSSGGLISQPGMPAEALGRQGSQGSTNSTSGSNTGNVGR